ncbi:hypothetical protein phiGrn1_0291 [Vibrio phage phi-Grn1]|uniref:Uncharacterized protein n=1 Tax=Vibrio phage phi-Grn1 TaxID=1747713 RepID=A0A140B3J3_9CAUD|nr:hypothetical protein phiGrn1_0291 [Vibrio phage phi-Grn1]
MKILPDFLDNTEIRRVISEKALELRQNTAILSDEDAYTCHILEDFVADTLGELCRLKAMRIIQDNGNAFCEHLQANPEAVFGRELTSTEAEYLNEIFQNKLSAFVHSVSRVFEDADDIDFVFVRKAWLKFLINSL